MLFRSLIGLTLAAVAGLLLASTAQASPGFTIKNTLKSEVDVYIFFGDETYCGAHEKHERIRAGKTRSYGCSGHGKKTCKVALFVDGREICGAAHNACSKSKIMLKDRSRVIVRPGKKTGKFLCDIK